MISGMILVLGYKPQKKKFHFLFLILDFIMVYHIPYSSNLVLNDSRDIIKEYALKQQCPIELSAVDMFYVCTVQFSIHQPHEVLECLEYG